MERTREKLEKTEERLKTAKYRYPVRFRLANAIGAQPLNAMLGRIDRRLERLGLSDRAASLAAGLSADQIRTMRRQLCAGTQHGASTRSIEHLAIALRTTPQWLMSGTGPEEPGERDSQFGLCKGIRLVGTVAAGIWSERPADTLRPDPPPIPADPRFPIEHQIAFEVRGNTIGRIAQSGDFLIVLDRAASGRAPNSNDLVIVTRCRSGIREVTARRCQVNGPYLELRFDSAGERPDEKIIRIRGDRQFGDGEFVSIDGVVVGVYRPLQ